MERLSLRAAQPIGLPLQLRSCAPFVHLWEPGTPPEDLLLSQNLLRGVCRCNKIDGALPIYLANQGQGLRPLPLFGFLPLTLRCFTAATATSRSSVIVAAACIAQGAAAPYAPKVDLAPSAAQINC